MPLYLFYTMVQKTQKWPKPQIKVCSRLNREDKKIVYVEWRRFECRDFRLPRSVPESSPGECFMLRKQVNLSSQQQTKRTKLV